MNLVLFGAPGSGKGTPGRAAQGPVVAPSIISTGDLLRDAVARKTELGKKVKASWPPGELVSDDIVLELIRDAIAAVGRRPEPEGMAARRLIRGRSGRRTGSGRAARGHSGRSIDAIVVLDVDKDAVVRALVGDAGSCRSARPSTRDEPAPTAWKVSATIAAGAGPPEGRPAGDDSRTGWMFTKNRRGRFWRNIAVAMSGCTSRRQPCRSTT